MGASPGYSITSIMLDHNPQVSMNLHQQLIQKEIDILDEIIESLLHPDNLGIDPDELFRLLNHYTVSTTKPKSPNDEPREVVSKLVEFEKVLDLGYKLSSSNTKTLTISEFVNMLSSNVYINHLPTNIQSVTQETYLDSLYYMPDLRLVLKNVFVLLLNYLTRIEPMIRNSPDYEASCEELKGFLLLFNISIVNKLVKIYKCLNPKLKMKAEVAMITLMSS